MSVPPPAPGAYQQYPHYPHYPQPARAFVPRGGFPHPYGRSYAPTPPRAAYPTRDPGTMTAIAGLVLFFLITLPIYVLGTVAELSPLLYLSATTSTLFVAVHSFTLSKRHGHTNVIAIITMVLCTMLLMTALVSTLLRLLLIL
ncbi:hypothetical protein [Tsukamurella paurometabola]|uniref:Uncharacterized protein n=1 Tax=Tsukamurella paurometabola TaxID=2061 RepID=A0A3P8MA42_TSUPA|nr:hypothetical protein [Tsukamurella paurometabola]UEA85130.1 hypothetical protein LK411_10080 [Tsukamurella paurometabola]VDR37740.1 Uncharacterised protein [Tsukamurella paurometabola]